MACERGSRGSAAGRSLGVPQRRGAPRRRVGRTQSHGCPPLRARGSSAFSSSQLSRPEPRDQAGVRGGESESGERARRFVSISVSILALGLSLACANATAAAGEAVASATGPRALLQQCVSFALHLDKHLVQIIQRFGEQKTYALLAGIVFCETGLVVTPFLPGDSLLFACGAFAALGSLRLQVLIVTLLAAAIAGDAVNYAVGQWVGRRILASGWISPKNIEKTERFYEKHGPKTIVLARFVPIVRTFAPFVAGVGSMEWRQFTVYNVVGAAVWTVSFSLLGYFFGNLPFVQHNFTLVVLAIVGVSVLPVIYELVSS